MNKLLILGASALLFSCASEQAEKPSADVSVDLSQVEWIAKEGGEGYFYQLSIEVPGAGRYEVELSGSCDSCTFWIEDYVDNKDGRTYNITGNMLLTSQFESAIITGSPLNEGTHNIKIHSSSDALRDGILTLQRVVEHKASPEVLLGVPQGDEWTLVWSDEFDYQGHADTAKWTYDLGNWGWGNNELQYYTVLDTFNAMVSDGTLKIKGRQDQEGRWSSARLTTRGKTAFTYGKIEFKAKVPTDRGTWSAGWLLGNSYVDEISWPYCGEIDVLECVGYEINDTTGAGRNHGTCHTPKYYFKKGNQISAQIEMDSMHTQFHTYAVEWDDREIRAYVDGEHYYTYDKSADELEWPFHEPQNIIINLAIGGGWGGAKGLDPNMTQLTFELDYVRVYQHTAE